MAREHENQALENQAHGRPTVQLPILQEDAENRGTKRARHDSDDENNICSTKKAKKAKEASSNVLETFNLYTVGWIAALPLELAAATAMLDEEHEKPLDFVQSQSDTNSYTWGRIGEHNVVIASLAAGKYGTTSAAATALPMLSSFPQVRIGLLVGIGAGIARPDQGCDIRLGDIAVSQPHGSNGGVVQYDLFKAMSGSQRKSRAFLNSPPEVLLKALAKLQAQHERKPSKVPEFLIKMVRENPKMAKSKHGYVHQGFENDRLFKAIDPNEEIPREKRDSTEPEIHYGIIASGNTLLKDATYRDEILKDIGEECICFEMEAAGLMNNFPCIVIRGICDYADAHKCDRWQRYAAATAAAYAKELLGYVPNQGLQETQKAIDLLGGIAREMIDIHSIVKNQNLDSQFNKINKWLRPPDPSTNFNKAIKERHKGTGSWFLESEQFKKWKSGTCRYLWLHGIPGCGKTVLCSTIIEHLRQNQDSASIILDFFFDFRDAEKQSLENLIRSFCAQLYSKYENSRKELDILFSKCEDGRQQPTTESLITTFQHMLNNVEKIQIIIDALDECKARRDLLLWMEEFSSHKNTNFKLIATSRAEAEIESELRRWLYQDNFISIQQEPVDSDIRAYVHKRLREDREFERWHSKSSVQDQIETELMKKAGGMFRWAACQLDVLQKCLDLRQLRESLRCLPKTLEETYTRILANIDENYKDYAIRILQFLTYSERPLTVEEAVDAVVVDLAGDIQFDCDLRMPNPQEITKICSSLVSLVTRPVNRFEEGEKEMLMELQLAHFSVKEYLISGQVEKTFQESLTEIRARGSITKVCLSYLSHLDRVYSVKEIDAKFPLARYSARYWMDHARPAETEKDVQKSIFEFFSQQRQAYEIWISFFDPYRPMASPLYYASVAGLEHTVKLLLNAGANVNKEGGEYGTALHAASVGGYDRIVQQLLDTGADVNKKHGYYGNALYTAVERGYEKIVQRLLDAGADVNKEGGEYGTALYVASKKGYEKIVQKLLDAGADVNKEDGDYSTALHVASVGGYDRIVQQLLKAGANMNIENKTYGTALQIASGRGYEKIVQQLLDARVDITEEDKKYGTALHAASAQGHEIIVQQLLNAGVDVNKEGREYGIIYWVDSVEDGYYGTALHSASARGHAKIVQKLLDAGANINKEGGKYGTALYAASAKGHEKTVQQLLDAGADVNKENGYYGTALRAASVGGHKEIVQKLLDAGADVNKNSGHYGNALHTASEGGYSKIVQQLLDAGADVNKENGYYGTALRAASKEGYDKIVQQLLDAGADVNQNGGYHGNALHAASEGGHEKIVQQLLDAGADVNKEAGKYGTALRAALVGGYDRIGLLQALSYAGAIVNIKDIERGYEKIVQRLLDAGADVNKGGE